MVAAILVGAGCGGGETPAPQPSGVAAPAPAGVFRDVTAQSGIDFVHEAGARGDYWLPEGIGSGGAFLDYDVDGDPDLFLVQGGWPEGPNDEWRSRLYRNDGGMRFTDVSEAAGADVPGYGLGAAAADWDTDGDPDLFVTRLGRTSLPSKSNLNPAMPASSSGGCIRDACEISPGARWQPWRAFVGHVKFTHSFSEIIAKLPGLRHPPSRSVKLAPFIPHDDDGRRIREAR